jgi:hypothetical protein
MDFHMAAVERHLSGRVGIAGDRGKYRLPNTPLAPACEAIVDRFVRPVLARAIFPPASNALDMHDAAQNPPIIVALRAGLVGRQMRFDFRPLLVAKPKQARIHGWPLNRLTNSLNQHMVN